METGSFEDAEEEAANQFSMQEDEMASWLHYPVHESFEPDIYADLLYPAPPGNYAPSCRCSLIQEDLQSVEKYPAASQPPIPPWRSPVREFLASEPASGGCAANASSEPLLKPPPPEDKKRKARESDNNNFQSEDVEFKSINAKKQVHGSTSARRTRAAEVHNLSERKRRDRINEKMKALQELIPSCNKSDKASMLDEAIEYLKSLQLQVQMLCSMVPMVYPSFQPYMSPMGMRMGMGMDMGLSRPMLPFPSSLAGSSMPTLAATPHLGLRAPMPAFHVLNPIGGPSPNQPQIPNFADPYQHYHGLHQMQVPPPQNQAMVQPSASKGVGTLENHQSG